MKSLNLPDNIIPILIDDRIEIPANSLEKPAEAALFGGMFITRNGSFDKAVQNLNDYYF